MDLDSIVEAFGPLNDAQCVIASTSIDCVVAVPIGIDDDIVAGFAVHFVVTGAAGKDIVAGPAVERVVATPSIEDIVAACTGYDVVTGSSVDDVIACGHAALLVPVVGVDVPGIGLDVIADDAGYSRPHGMDISLIVRVGRIHSQDLAHTVAGRRIMPGITAFPVRDVPPCRSIEELPPIRQRSVSNGIRHAVGIREGNRGGQHLAFGRRHVADQESSDRLVIDDADDPLRRRREDRFRHAARVGISPDHANAQPGFRIARGEGGADSAIDVDIVAGAGIALDLPPIVDSCDDPARIVPVPHVFRRDRQHLALDCGKTIDRQGARRIDVPGFPDRVDLIGKLDALDVDERVDSLVDLPIDQPVIAAGDYDTVADPADFVLVHAVRENRRIGVIAAVGVENLADDVQLAWLEPSLKHGVIERDDLAVDRPVKVVRVLREQSFCGPVQGLRHAVGRGNLPAAAIAHDDPNVEPCVAVDDIVAALALEPVVAVTAEQDVGSVSGLHHDRVGVRPIPGQVAQQFAKAGNAGDTRFREGVGPGIERGIRSGDRGSAIHLVTGTHGDGASGQDIVVLPARQTLDEVEAVAKDELLLVLEDANTEVGVRRSAVALMNCPVEPGHAVVALDADALDHDVVAGLAVIVRVALLPVQDVMADDRAVEEKLRVLAGQGVEIAAALDPVVSCFTHQEVNPVTAQDEVPVSAPHDGFAIRAGDQEVFSLVAEDE